MKGVDEMTDAQLLLKLRLHSEDALAQLSGKYRSYVLTVLQNVLGPDGSFEDAEELCSDVFYGLWRSAAGIEPAKLKAYLGTAARNRAKSWLRRRRELPMDLDTVEIPDGMASLEDQAVQKELAEAVRRAVDSLRKKDREIFLRYYYYLQSTEKIADEMGIPAATVRSRLSRGRETLRRRLEKEVKA